MTVERIEFSLVHGSEDQFPRPYPANRDVPDWFKTMPSEADFLGKSLRTTKNCPPFLEAMTCGYIIPLATEINLAMDTAGVFHGQARDANILQFHRAAQVHGAPFENIQVVKILNPWLIRTPPGYSTLFLPLLNRFHMPVIPFSGLVETDLFYREVNFPALLTIPHGTNVTLARGTPIVQVIPIKRDEFYSEFVPPDREKYDIMDLNTRDIPENYNYYKNNFWRKKIYR